MADNRIIFKVGDSEIVVAKCHGPEWRAGFDDLGAFLSKHAFSEDNLQIEVEWPGNYLPKIELLPNTQMEASE